MNAHSPVLSTTDIQSNPTGRSIEHLILNENCSLINPLNFYTYLNAANGRRSCLDICITSTNIAAGASMQLLEDVGSDHLPTKIILVLEPVFNVVTGRRRWKINKDNIEIFSKNIKQSELPQPANVNQITKDLTERILASAECTIGRTSGRSHQRKQTPWWDEECSRAVAHRRHARRNLERHPLPQNMQIYREATEDTKTLLKVKRQKSFRKMISDIHYDTPSSVIWGKIKSLKGYNTPDYAPLEHAEDVITQPVDKAQLFATHFQSVARTAGHIPLDDFDTLLEDAVQEGLNEDYNIEITMQELNLSLSHSKNTTPGIDNIPYKFLTSLPTEIMTELLNLMNQSYKTGELPSSWKHVLVIPIPKPGKTKTDVKNFRPIAMLSCMGKTLERIIQRRLEYVSEKKKLLSGSQCGFRRGQGTIDILLRLENTIRKSLATNKICLVVYLDLKSAFDTVWGEGLVYKLIRRGLQGPMIGWLHNYFKDRRVQVQVEGSISEPVDITAGTPQGAVLSPLLFNLMLMDIPQEDDVKLYIYADDITISCTGENIQMVRDRMQHYLNQFEIWADTWGIILNTSKTYTQHFTKKKFSAP